MNKREITSRIRLTGIKPTGYTIRTSRFDGLPDIEVVSVATGNAIVRALREEASRRPGRFPASKQPRKLGVA